MLLILIGINFFVKREREREIILQNNSCVKNRSIVQL